MEVIQQRQLWSHVALRRQILSLARFPLNTDRPPTPIAADRSPAISDAPRKISTIKLLLSWLKDPSYLISWPPAKSDTLRDGNASKSACQTQLLS